MNCTECDLPFEGQLDDVSCDGCHRLFHRRHLHYVLIDVEWDTQPKAYAFCRECDDDGLD